MLTGIVLAGGRSSRMGSPKALLPFDGEPLIVHIVRRLQSLCADIVVVAAPGQQLPPMPVTLVHDEVAYQGPVGGISYGLEAAAGELGFVTTCDAAFSSLALVSHLAAQAVEYDVVVPRWDGRLQPLVAVYRKTVRPLLREQLARGELRPVRLFDKVRTRIVEADEIRRFDADGASFFNMNTPDDYAEALRRWHADTGRGASDATLTCTVELLGVARLVAGTGEVALTLPAGARLQDVFGALAQQVPAMAGRVVAAGGRGLKEGYACNVNGLDFVRDSTAPVHRDDRLVIVSADAGG